ncbi:MAG: quinate 5-dehydrogenase [Actinobacteria bacterium]|nr:MAG: quinate 5-dehydrogenase [Actinomycetota bacterium]
MRRVVSASLGSSKRDHEVRVSLLGEQFSISRIGTDGDWERQAELLKELDGKVDAIGLGGIDLYLYAGGKRYTIRDAKKLIKDVKRTPVVDGSGLKNSLERETVRYMVEDLKLPLAGKTVLMTSAVDRFGMAEALHEAGCKVMFGDLIYGLKIPVMIRSMRVFTLLAKTLLPIVTKMPFEMLYPTGSKQDKEPEEKYSRYYREADVIAGDYLFVRKYMPADMSGKWIVTNTVTPSDLKDMSARGVELLVTTTPELEGRSFGTNVMEATIVALTGKRPEEMTPSDYLRILREVEFTPRIEWMNGKASSQQT